MIFLDTGFLFGLMSTKDEHHDRVVEVFGAFKGARLADQILTTNHVVAESLTLTRKLGHEKAAMLGERLCPALRPPPRPHRRQAPATSSRPIASPCLRRLQDT